MWWIVASPEDEEEKKGPSRKTPTKRREQVLQAQR
jgi:hypothetical protein